MCIVVRVFVSQRKPNSQVSIIKNQNLKTAGAPAVEMWALFIHVLSHHICQ